MAFQVLFTTGSISTTPDLTMVMSGTNAINTIGTTPIAAGTTSIAVGTTSLTAGTTSVAIGTTSLVAGTTSITAGTTTHSSTTVVGHSTLIVGTNTLSDPDDGVVLLVGNTTPLIAHNTLVFTNPLSVANGTLSITSDSILGPDTLQSFPIHGSVLFGGPQSSSLTIHQGDIAFAGDGGDTISMVPLIGAGASLGHAFMFGGVGNDTFLDFSTQTSPVPVTAVGGPGDDTFVVESVAPAGTTFTGGPGHDLFHFSTLPTHSADVTITDFSSHDAIVIDTSTILPPTITFTDSRNATTVDAVAAGGSVHLTLVGTFDQSQFHVADDGHNHAVITFGNSDFVLS